MQIRLLALRTQRNAVRQSHRSTRRATHTCRHRTATPPLLTRISTPANGIARAQKQTIPYQNTLIHKRYYCKPDDSGWDMPPPKGKWKKGKDEKEKEKEEEEQENKSENDSENTKKRRGLLIAMALVGGTIFLVYITRETGQEITYIQFQNELLVPGFVDHLEIINQNKVRVFMKGDFGRAAYYMKIASVRGFEAQLADSFERLGITEEILPTRHKSEVEVGKAVLRAMPLVLTIAFFVYAWKRLSPMSALRSSGGIFSIGKSTAKLATKGKVKVTFKDVAGCDEAKVEVSEFVSFLKDAKRYQALGATIPKGALLVGPPGTGKTLLAKATAGEADVPFYSVSGSDFIEVFGGVGPARVRDLFKQARESAPSIVFLDEIDAIGRKRSVHGMRNEERENTLNQLLVEMDGFNSTTGVVILAGTNRPDILDPALTRPGRFDRQISIDLPDIKSRVAIFAIHLAKLKLDPKQSVEELKSKLSQLTPGFSGADIANVCNEAALIAARNDHTHVTLPDFEAAIDRVIAGLEKKSKVLSPAEKKRVAFHEAGHALVGWLLRNTDPVLKVSIIPRGSSALGFAQLVPPEERYLHTQEFLRDRACVLLAGRAAEKVFFGDVSSGAQDDLEKVTGLVYAEILKYGMNERVGSLSFQDQNSGYFGKQFSEATNELVDSEVRQIVQSCFDMAMEMITSKKAECEKIAQLLLAKEVLAGDDIKGILGPKVGSPEWEQAQSGTTTTTPTNDAEAQLSS